MAKVGPMNRLKRLDRTDLLCALAFLAGCVPPYDRTLDGELGPEVAPLYSEVARVVAISQAGDGVDCGGGCQPRAVLRVLLTDWRELDLRFGDRHDPATPDGDRVTRPCNRQRIEIALPFDSLPYWRSVLIEGAQVHFAECSLKALTTLYQVVPMPPPPELVEGTML